MKLGPGNLPQNKQKEVPLWSGATVSLAKGTGEGWVVKARIQGSQRLLCSVDKKLWSACDSPSFHPWVSREPPLPHASLSNTLLSPTWAGPCHAQNEGWARHMWGLVVEEALNPQPSTATQTRAGPCQPAANTLSSYSW